MATSGQRQLYELSRRLLDAGTEGQGLRRQLSKAVGEAAKPLAAEIGSVPHLDIYLPNRYAGVLADDLSVTASQRGTVNPAVTIRARPRVRRRQLLFIEAGFLRHPVFARDGVPRRRWTWRTQTAPSVHPRFFFEPCERAVPDIRDKVIAAMHDIGQKITGG